MIVHGDFVIIMLTGKINGEIQLPVFYAEPNDNPEEALARCIHELESAGYTDVHEIDDEVMIFTRNPEEDNDGKEPE